jgi:hypothetical protein
VLHRRRCCTYMSGSVKLQLGIASGPGRGVLLSRPEHLHRAHRIWAPAGLGRCQDSLIDLSPLKMPLQVAAQSSLKSAKACNVNKSCMRCRQWQTKQPMTADGRENNKKDPSINPSLRCNLRSFSSTTALPVTRHCVLTHHQAGVAWIGARQRLRLRAPRHGRPEVKTPSEISAAEFWLPPVPPIQQDR